MYALSVRLLLLCIDLIIFRLINIRIYLIVFVIYNVDMHAPML